jgi:hypothetical protein
MLILIPWLCENIPHIDRSVTSAIGKVVRNDSNHNEGCSEAKVISVYRKIKKGRGIPRGLTPILYISSDYSDLLR